VIEQKLTLSWLPINKTSVFRVQLSQLNVGEMVTFVLPFDKDSNHPFNELMGLTLLRSDIYVGRGLKSLSIRSETSMGASMNMHFVKTEENVKSGLRIEFEHLDKLRPSLFCANLQFLDDFTAGFYNFAFSSFKDETQGLYIKGYFPLYNKILKELHNVIDFTTNDDNRLEFAVKAKNLQNFRIEIALAEDQKFDGWALQENVLFFKCENDSV